MPRGLNYDNKILSIVNNAVDMLILGIFWFVTSIPLVTIGASTTAVYYTCLLYTSPSPRDTR